jgi:hypothetical protein
MRRTLIFATAALVALVAGPWLTAADARACAIDSVPSLTADGQIDRLTQNPPTTAAELATFAPFELPRSYAVGHTIVFAELRNEVAKSLVPDAMKRPWHWQFGDGASAAGWTVRHAYTQPGRHRIVVEAYSPVTRQWIQFDQVSITIAAAPRSKHR